MKIYKHGCLTCGVDSVYIRRVYKYCQEQEIPIEVFNSKYNSTHREAHAKALESAGLSLDSYQPIVIDSKVTPLRSWQPS